MVFNKRRVKHNIPIYIRLGPLLLHKIDLDTTEYFFFYLHITDISKNFFFSFLRIIGDSVNDFLRNQPNLSHVPRFLCCPFVFTIIQDRKS